MLTEAIGVTPPTLYSAFGSKENLYCEALDFYQREGLSNDRAPGKGRKAREIVEAFLRASAIRFSGRDGRRGCMMLIGSIQCGPDGEGAVKATAAARAVAIDRFEAMLEAAKVGGEIAAATDTRTLAKFYTAVIQGMAVQATDGGTRRELDALVDVALRAWPATE